MPGTQGGRLWSFSAGPGVGTQGLLTQSGDLGTNWAGQQGIASTGVNPVNNPAAGKVPNLAYYLIGILAVLVLLKFLSEHDKAKMELGHQRISVWNFIVTGIFALLFIDAGKAILNQHPVRGLTQLFNAA